ncbi:zinc finger protein 831 [Saccopteryx leptura]|uniref:zinc finger protein 831 n=1 Tax=Saccopteryx leptura TaxID=249018 RepID=UPI00339BE133
MEVPELTSPASPARDQPAPAPGPPRTPSQQVSPHLTLGPVILPPEQGRAPTVFLKALPLPLYHTVPPGGLQPRAPLVTGSVDGGSTPFILSTLLQPEGPGLTQAGKPATPVLTVNIVGTLPVLSPGLGPAPGSLGKVRNAGKYLCPHCGRDCLKPSVLEKHIRSHTGERPFPCATCGIAFKTQSNLYKHRRTQTHLNNSRLPSESEGTGGSLLEEGDKAGQTSRTASKGGHGSPGRGDAARSDRPLSPGGQGAEHCLVPPMHLSPAAKNLDLKLGAVSCPGSTLLDREAPLDSTHPTSAGLPLAGLQSRRKLLEKKSPTGSRTSSEKPWDTKASEGRLRKCESTDSGYLSRSDSVEQPLLPGSPLHSLSEHSAESEGEGTPEPERAGAELGGRGPSLEQDKRQLEERIARLISHNQAVVDDPQLDHVRPRKTVLSKQGSIDLPMPYTYKDSFHFEIRALEPCRRRHGALGPTRSTCTPVDKVRALFFHSVPTQLSATVECVPVTRSNSLPLVEGTRTWQEQPNPQDACSGRQKPPSPRPAHTRLVDVPSGHPRALVRQVAVEDLPCPPTGDTATPKENMDAKKAVTVEGTTSKGRGAGRKGSQRKLKMFSQEKWQVYGNETFQRIYQKGRTGHQGGRKGREVSVGRGTELDLPLRKEVLSQDRRTPVCGDTSVGAKPGAWGSLPTTEGFLVTESPKQRETVARAGDSDQPKVSRATSPPILSCREPPCLGSKSPVLPPNGKLELECQLPPAPDSLQGGDLEAPKLKGGTQGGEDTKEPCKWALIVPRQPSSSSGEPQPARDKLPSERKKLRVEETSCPEWSETLGAGGQAPGHLTRATSPPSWSQDCDPGDKPGGLHRSADCMVKGQARPLEASGVSFSASSGALRPAGLSDTEPAPGPAAGAPGGDSQLATQPRAPRGPAALTDTAFPPKYLLRFPRGDALPPSPGTQGPGRGQDPPGRSGQLEELASSAGSGLRTILPSHPAAGLAPCGADSFEEDPGWSRLWGRREGVLGEEKGDLDTSTPAGGESPSSSAGAPREMASILSTLTCDSRRTETHNTTQLCVGSTWAESQPSGGVLSSRALSRDMRGASENAREDPLLGPSTGHSPWGSLWPSSALSELPPPGWPELAPRTRSECPGSCGPQGSFPSLRAEPRLTWCCLSHSLPLPMEQKGKAASVYGALHSPGSSAPEEGANARLVSKAVLGRWTRSSPADGEETQPWKLSYPTAPGGRMSRDPRSEPEQKKVPPWRRTKMSRGSSKQKKLRRYRRNFLQGHVQLRASRLRKPLWVLRKGCHRSLLEGPDPRRTLRQASSGMAGLGLQGEPSCATSTSSPGCGNEEKEEEDRRPSSGSVSSSTSPGATRERDTLPMQDVIPSAGEPGDYCPQNTVVRSGSSLPSDSCVQVANNSLLSHGKGLDVGLLEAQLLPSQEQVLADPKLCVFSDAQEPSSFESKGNSPCHDVATSVAAICTSLGARGGHTTLGTHSAEPQDHGQATGETQNSPDERAVAQGRSLSLRPGKPSPEQRPSGLVPLRSPGKARLEIPAPGPGLASLCQEEGRPQTRLPSSGQHGCREMPVSCPPLGKDHEKCQESGLTALKDSVVPSKPGQPTEVPETPSKTIKKRSLEGMRKQTRVEFSDSSSDDEDRLVIEI